MINFCQQFRKKSTDNVIVIRQGATMDAASGIILGVFIASMSAVAAPVICSSLFFRWLNYMVDRSEGDGASDW